MRRSLFLLPLAALAFAAGGYALARHGAALRLVRTETALRALLGPGAVLRYADARAETLGAGVDFAGVSIRNGALDATMDALRIAGARPDGARRIDATALRVSNGHATLSAAHARLAGLSLRDRDPATLRFVRAELTDAHAADDRSGIHADADRLAAYGYGAGAHGGLEAARLEVALAGDGLPDRVRVGRTRAEGIDLAAWAAQARGLPVAAAAPDRPAIRAEARDIALLRGGRLLATIAGIEAGSAPAAPGGTDSHMRADGIAIGRDAAPALAELGYETLRLGVEERQHADRDAGRLALAPLRVAGKDAGTLSLDAELTGLPAWNRSAPAALPTIRVVSARVAYRDASLFGRVLAAAARRRGMPPERLRAEWRAGLDAAEATIPPPPAPLAALIGDMRRFLDRPGTFSVAIGPDAPVPVMQLGAAFANPAMLDALHLRSEAK